MGFVIVSVEQAEGSVALDMFTPEEGKKYALVFGHEVKGVSDEVVSMSDVCLEIPQYGTKHSFNVAVSAGIVLWELTTRLRKK
jgi:tRNA G18 (ribose-2'-O)-methylase SpoU